MWNVVTDNSRIQEKSALPENRQVVEIHFLNNRISKRVSQIAELWDLYCIADLFSARK